MKRRIPRPLTLAIAAALAFASAGLHADSESDGAPTDKASNALYWQGQAALKQSDWSTALKHFRDLEAMLRTNEPKSADAALYWEAYALAQAHRTAEAKGVVDRLHREFPESRWTGEADALVARTHVGATKHSDDSEDLADIAVAGLLNAPPDRALPLLEKVMKSNRPVATKKRALFVLSQLDDERALNDIIDTAKNASEPELRAEAIRMLGVSGDRGAIEKLRDIYASSTNADEKGHIIEAWLIADRKDLVLASARNESDPGVRRKAIETLGALGASHELAQLLDSTRDASNRRAIIQSLGVAGDTKSLAAIAGNAKLPEDERIDAARALGVAGDHGGEAALVDLYAKADSPKMRDAALQGLLITGDSKAVVQLYRNAKTPEEKKAVLRTLSVMDDDAALDVIERRIDQPEPR